MFPIHENVTTWRWSRNAQINDKFTVACDQWTPSMILRLGTVKTIFLQIFRNFYETRTFFNLWGSREVNPVPVGPTGCQRGTWIPFKGAPSQNEISHWSRELFHISISVWIRSSKPRTAPDGSQYASFKTAKNFLWQICQLEVLLAVAVDVAGLGGVRQSGSLVCVQRWVRVQTFRHLVTDHIYKSLKHSLKI